MFLDTKFQLDKSRDYLKKKKNLKFFYTINKRYSHFFEIVINKIWLFKCQYMVT